MDPIAGKYTPIEKRMVARRLAREVTEAEVVLWSRLRANRLQNLRFRRQQPLYGFIVDFYCHQARLVIEVDGAVHEGQADYDAERSRILATKGYRILRFSNHEVLTNPKHVMLEILKACR